MGKLIEELATWGCDIDGVMERFMGDKSFYYDCIEILLADKEFLNLGEQIKKSDIALAYISAHSLKGVISNMGITPMYTTIKLIVDKLHDNSLEDLDVLYEELMTELDYLKSLAEK